MIDLLNSNRTNHIVLISFVDKFYTLENVENRNIMNMLTIQKNRSINSYESISEPDVLIGSKQGVGFVSSMKK
jgi:hypothetical protein